MGSGSLVGPAGGSGGAGQHGLKMCQVVRIAGLSVKVPTCGIVWHARVSTDRRYLPTVPTVKIRLSVLRCWEMTTAFLLLLLGYNITYISGLRKGHGSGFCRTIAQFDPRCQT